LALTNPSTRKNALKALADKGLVMLNGERVHLALDQRAARLALYELRGVDKYLPVLEVVRAADGPIWKSDLYAQVKTDLAALRALQDAGLVELTEAVRFRDPLAGRTYPRTTAPPLTSEQADV